MENGLATEERPLRRHRPGTALVLCALGWLFTMFVAVTFVQYRNDPLLSVFAVGASLVMMVGTLLLSVRPRRSRLWSAILVATSLVYWAELFVEFGDAGLAWGLVGPFYTLVGGVLVFVSSMYPRSNAA